MAFTGADHERARRAGQQAMAKLVAQEHATLRSDSRSSKTRFPGLGVRVKEGRVRVDEWMGKDLGPLAGACAEVVSGQRVHNIAAAALTLMPIVALTRRTQGAAAFVVFPHGNVHQHRLADPKAVTRAERDAVRFNALAAAA